MLSIIIIMIIIIIIICTSLFILILYLLCAVLPDAARYRSAIGKSANQSPFNRKVVGSSPTIPYAQFVPSFLAVGV